MQPILIRPAMIVIPILMATLAMPAARAGEVPYGHKDFYPSPERPVGFRGDGNGAFPGATPVISFREGDVTQIEMEVALWGDAGGNQLGTFKKTKVPVLANDKRVNVVWKTEMPGFSNSSPIVVGDRVFCMADPYTLVCVDIPTGKILWQRDINPLELQGLPKEQCERCTELMEITWAVHSIEGALLGNYGHLGEKEFTESLRASLRERYALLHKLALQAVERDPAKEFGAQELLTKVEEIQKVIEAEPLGPKDQSAGEALVKRLGKMALHMCIEGPIRKRFGIYVKDHWAGMVNHEFPTPVSDGARVCVSLGQGQVAAYDLSGNRLWAKHFPVKKPRDFNRCMHCPSPLLIGNVLVVQQFEALVGLNKATGEVLWQNPDITTKASFNMGTSRHVRVGTGAGARDLICTTFGDVVDANTGKVLANVVEKTPWTRWDVAPPVMATPGGVVFWRDQSVNENVLYSVSLDPTGQVQTKKIAALTTRPGTNIGGHALILDGDRLICTRGWALYDMTTGNMSLVTPIQKERVRFEGVGAILAGQYVIGRQKGNDDDNLRNRADELLFTDYAVVDLTDAAKPKVIQNQNILGGFHKPHVRHIEKWLPELDQKGWVTRTSRPAKAMWAMMGVPPNWGFSSPAAQGNRLFLRSHSHLYCIGDPNVPYDWNPASRPQDISQSLAK